LELVSTYFLPDGSQLFVPTRSFRTSNDQEIGLLGIEPDVVVNLDWDAVTFTDDPVREAAVEALLNG
jgi:C-terminal processing protease CtpA/Prc